MGNPNTAERVPFLPGTAIGATSTAELDAKDSQATPVVAKFYLPGSNILLNRPFLIRAAGRATGGTTTNLTVKVYIDSTAVFSSGAIAVNSVSGNFLLECLLFGDSTSAQIIGLGGGWVNLTAVARAITTALTSADFATETIHAVKVTFQFSASHANNAAVLQELVLDVL
jgi:hypothetical protein